RNISRNLSPPPPQKSPRFDHTIPHRHIKGVAPNHALRRTLRTTAPLEKENFTPPNNSGRTAAKQPSSGGEKLKDVYASQSHPGERTLPLSSLDEKVHKDAIGPASIPLDGGN
ncbi:hypothetical protein AVEN_15168-1, partial [Araneus ventricosus]